MPEHGPNNSRNETRKALLLQVAALESEMAQTRALLLEQERERRRLYSKINSLSQIDQLPAEIKIEIFSDALRLLQDPTGEVEKPMVTPFFLGRICGGWRDFVWSSPILWTNLHLCLSRHSYKAQTTLLYDWLSRTANYPLFFCLTTLDSNKAWTSDPPIEILSMFASVSAQWKEVEFFLPNTKECFDAIESTAENSLPLLTAATARLISTERQLNLFSTAPQLSVLRLFHPYLSKVLAPWHQLREFTSDACTVDEIRDFFLKAPNIVRCYFLDIDSGNLDHSRDHIFDRLPVLEYLEYLELSFISVEPESAWVLGPVKLPSLHEVSLYGPFGILSDTVLPPIMTSFHSSHLLEKFTFSGEVTSDHDLIQVLESIPSVKELFLDFEDQDPDEELLTKELLQRLYPHHTDLLLPNLRTFTYHGPTSLNDHIHVFRDVLVCRFRRSTLQPAELNYEQRTVCQIQSVKVTTPSELVISPDIQEELDSLVQEGLDLSLTSNFVPNF